MSEWDEVANEFTSLIFKLNNGWSDLYRLEIEVLRKARQLNGIRPSMIVSEIITTMERIEKDMGAVVDAADALHDK
jgi:hypothetical protein